MHNATIPKVLIFSQPFNDYSGGGITLTSLFGGYPKEHLAVLTYPFMLFSVSFETCEKYYQIGREEYRWTFPFGLFKRSFNSGLIKKEKNVAQSTPQKPSIKNQLSTYIINPFLRWTGLSHCISHIELSDQLRYWLFQYKPDILYLQISNRESINFSLKLMEFLMVPTIIHLMDDWPSTISSKGPLKKYWQKRIDKELRALLAKSDLCFSISDAMSEEYQKRYGRMFIPFHNSVDPERFSMELPSKSIGDKKFRILYIGRIGTANRNSLHSFATFISGYNTDGLSIVLDIYTKDNNSSYTDALCQLKRVTVRKAVNHSEVPLLLKSYDLLLLPLDFTGSGLTFSKLSMPTKASEYMMSGIPILVFAPKETAISKFCHKYRCGHCVTSTDSKTLTESLDILSHDIEYREELGTNAVNLAVRLFDVRIVREEFKRQLSGLIEIRDKN